MLIPAAWLCEALGLGQFSLLEPSTIPDWVLFAVMGILAYLSSLVLVLIARGIFRLLRHQS